MRSHALARLPFLRKRGRKRLAPDGVRITEWPPSIVTMLRLYEGFGSYSALYRAQPNVRFVVDFISSEVASLKLKVYERVPSSLLLPSSRVELDDSDLQLLLNRPSGPVSSTTSNRVTRNQFWRQIVSDIGVFDTAYARKVRAVGGRPAAVYRVPVPSLYVVRDPLTQAITNYRTTTGKDINPEDLIVFPGYDPDYNQGSVSPLETLRRNLAEEWAMGKFREWMWHNGARRDGIITRPLDAEPMSDEALQAFLEDFAAAHSGIQNSGKPAFLDEGMGWQESQFNARETEYIAARKLNRAECAAAYGVPAALVGASDAAVTQDERTMWYSDRLAPFLSRLEEEIDLQLLPEFEVSDDRARRRYTRFNLDEKLRGSFEQQAAILSTSTGRPWLTVNEARARLNLPPIEDGDDLTLPLNVMIGGQQSPQAPLETPATPAGNLEPAGTTPMPRGASLARVTGRFVTTTAAPVRFVTDGAVALAPTKAAAPPAVLRRRERATDEFAEVLRKTFERQSRAVLSAGKRAKAAVDWDRYDRELSADLYAATRKVADQTGALAARQIRSTYDPERTQEYLKTTSDFAAANINRQTREAVDLAEDTEGLRHVFDVALGSRVAQLALSSATATINFARTEAGHQSGGGKKTWVVTSSNSRHPELDGETVGIDDEFSNGLRWPGDASGDEGQTAGCACLLDLEAGG